MPNMEREKTTHLVALRPEGDKYTAAVQWKAHVVPPSWVNDCVERKSQADICISVSPSSLVFIRVALRVFLPPPRSPPR